MLKQYNYRAVNSFRYSAILKTYLLLLPVSSVHPVSRSNSTQEPEHHVYMYRNHAPWQFRFVRLPLLHSWSQLSSVYRSTPSSKFDSISSILNAFSSLRPYHGWGTRSAGSLGRGLGIPLWAPYTLSFVHSFKCAVRTGYNCAVSTRVQKPGILLRSL